MSDPHTRSRLLLDSAGALRWFKLVAIAREHVIAEGLQLRLPHSSCRTVRAMRRGRGASIGIPSRPVREKMELLPTARSVV